MPRSSYVQGVPFPSSRLQQQQEKEAIAQAAALSAQQHAIAQATHQSHHQQPQLHASPRQPAFYDANRGILYDGQQAFFYQPDANSNATFTAVELGHGGHHHQQQSLVDSKPITSFPPILLSNSVLSPVDSLQSAMALEIAFCSCPMSLRLCLANQPSTIPIVVSTMMTSEQQLSANQQQQRAFYQQQVQDLNNNRSGYLFSA
uniref:Uncharacterized protein n=1 Tax=Ditylenchus dipsaci TaxID=166011 RepID=A0A915EN21_9BILA